MTGERLKSLYTERIRSYGEAISYRTRLINYISLLRLVVLVGAVYLVIMGVRSGNLLNYFGAAMLVVSFLVLVSYHNRHNERRELLRKLKDLNEVELSCQDHRFDDLPDGSRFRDDSHPWSADLDLFGNGSLFQYMNRTSTLKGSEILANTLTREPRNAEKIRERQSNIGDLKDLIEFRQVFTARANLIREEEQDFNDLKEWIGATGYIKKNRWLFPVALLMAAISTGIIVAGLIHAAYFKYLLPVLLVNWSLLSPFLMRTNRYQSGISKKHTLLEGYAALLKLIADARFSTASLICYQDQAQAGQKEISRLSGLLNVFDQRLNMLLGSILNSLFLFDFIMLYLLERWKDMNSHQILTWIELTGWMDAMISLSGFAFNHPGYSIPSIDADRQEVSFLNLGHPLIPDRRRVDNTYESDQESVVIITGANMAGKSTFLRAIGVNMVLAYAGCPVRASRFESGMMSLYTSMRTADSLKDEESYFLAEIRRLQHIVEKMQEKKQMLILLDEVLKGTNTTDKKKGSVGLIEKALHFPILCFIATHDLSLGELEKKHQGKVVNYCFESYIEGLDLKFDYKIRRGLAKNMNASFLMRQMGIMD